MSPNYQAINANRERQQRAAASARISDIARDATSIQKQTGCTRTEALRIAERAKALHDGCSMPMAQARDLAISEGAAS